MHSSLPRRQLFLDLEDTVITPVVQGWGSVDLINIDKVRRFIDVWKPDTLNIFSFAMHDERDLQGFEEFVRPALSKALGMPISQAPGVNSHIVPALCALMHLSPQKVEFSDVSDFWSKHEGFRLFVRATLANKAPEGIDVALLDDAVFDEDFHWPGLCLRGKILNIDTLA